MVCAQVHNYFIAFVLILRRDAGVRMGWSRGWLLIVLVMWCGSFRRSPEKKSSHCARKQSPSFSRVVALERQGPSLNGIWTLTQLPAFSQAELQQCWRRAGFRAGSGFYNSGLTSGLRVRKGLDWFKLYLCESQHCVVGGSAQAHRAQPVDAPAGLQSRQSHLTAGAGVQMCAFGQLTCT